MKHVKHCLFAALTALLLMVAFGGAAFAQTTHTITINPGATSENSAQPAGHTYKAYQIFTCGYNSATKEVSSVQWSDATLGQNIVTNLLDNTNKSQFSTAIQNKIADGTNGLNISDDSSTSAGKVAGIIDSIHDNENDAKVFAQIVKKSLGSNPPASYSFTENQGLYTASVPTGYYLIVDESAPLSKENDYVSDLILRVVGESVTLSPKGNVPTVQKKVNTSVNASNVANGTWQDAADYNIKDIVPFQLTGTLPSDFDKYTSYKYIFTDTYSPGLTPNLSTIKIYVDKDGNTSNTGDRTEITQMFGTPTSENNTFTLTCENLKTADGITANSKIIVEYNATLNENAVIGTTDGNAGNPNTVKLTYSNNPTGDGTGDTPPDTVYVFTYELDVDKVNRDNHGDPVVDAKFILFSKDKNAYASIDSNNHKITGWVARESASTLTSDTNGKFTVIGLDAGEYTLTETHHPTEYADPANPETKFTITPTFATTENPATAADAITNLQVTTQSALPVYGADKATGKVNLMITNNRTGSLPSTGSMGMFIMIGVGICLMAGAGIYLLKNRKKA